MSPNHALQRTAPGVTVAASAATFPPTLQLPRRPPHSLSLGSLGHSRNLPEERAALMFTPESPSCIRASLAKTNQPPSPVITNPKNPPQKSAMRNASWRAEGEEDGQPTTFAQKTLPAEPTAMKPNQALHRTAPARHTGCSHRLRPQPPFRSRCAAPPQSLSLGSLGDAARVLK